MEVSSAAFRWWGSLLWYSLLQYPRTFTSLSLFHARSRVKYTLRYEEKKLREWCVYGTWVWVKSFKWYLFSYSTKRTLQVVSTCSDQPFFNPVTHLQKWKLKRSHSRVTRLEWVFVQLYHSSPYAKIKTSCSQDIIKVIGNINVCQKEQQDDIVCRDIVSVRGCSNTIKRAGKYQDISRLLKSRNPFPDKPGIGIRAVYLLTRLPTQLKIVWDLPHTY